VTRRILIALPVVAVAVGFAGAYALAYLIDRVDRAEEAMAW